MAILKCKMCGGDLEVLDGVTVCECEYCGTKQTVPTTQDEVITNLYNRANNLRIRSEFDKAQETYEKIVSKNPDEAEAYWGIVLCKYGIEYVEDPDTFKRVPTCHRTQLESVMTDVDYLSAIEHADSIQKDIYEQEAKAIDLLQKDILSIVHKEKPFDVFICYKETDENGKRTVDSVVANDIYHQLTQEGFKVFYAAITLEDKLGQEYEPYIFAALNSSKVMLVVGTKPEHFNAVWVKNEWSRYLKLMKNDRKRTLIPCYRDMDAYDLPEEFSHLQAQDMGKIGFINDVVRGIKKLIVTEEPRKQETVVINQTANANIEPLLKRAFIFLEDKDWDSANEYAEKVLDQEPENAQAYLVKLMAELKISKQDDLRNCEEPFADKANFEKICRYDSALSERLNADIDYINERNENNRLENLYQEAIVKMKESKDENSFKSASRLFEAIKEYKDSSVKLQECLDKAETARKDKIYDEAIVLFNTNNQTKIRNAKQKFQQIKGWKDSDEFAMKCDSRVDDVNEIAYKDALNKLLNAKDYESAEKALDVFHSIDRTYKDVPEQIKNCKKKKLQFAYDDARKVLEDNDKLRKKDDAKSVFDKIRLFRSNKNKYSPLRKIAKIAMWLDLLPMAFGAFKWYDMADYGVYDWTHDSEGGIILVHAMPIYVLIVAVVLFFVLMLVRGVFSSKIIEFSDEENRKLAAFETEYAYNACLFDNPYTLE